MDLFLCCSRRRDTLNPPILKDLSINSVDNPLQKIAIVQTIDSDLERIIFDWEQSILSYDRSELLYVEKISEEDRDRKMSILFLIRKDPFAPELVEKLKEEDAEVILLLNKRIDVINMEKKLPFSGGFDPNRKAVVKEDNSNFYSVGKDDGQKQFNGGTTYNVLSRSIAKLWSDRLNLLNPTQGSIKFEKDSTLEDELKVRPKWPSYLSDIYFSVVKVNKYGQKLNRIIKLTQHHVISIKNGRELTKFYLYEDIRRVWIESGNVVRVLQRSDKVNIYICTMAIHLVQQICTRVRVRHSLNVLDLNSGIEGGFSFEMTEQIIKSISEANASAAEEVLVNFARELKQQTIKSLSEEEFDSTVVDYTSLSSRNVRDQNSVQELEVLENKSHEWKSSALLAERNKIKLTLYKEGTPEFLIQARIRAIICDSSSPEGNTINLFIEKYLKEEVKTQNIPGLTRIRHFIDGMHEHLVENRSASLGMLYQQEKQRLVLKVENEDSPSLERERQIKVFMRRDSLRFLKENNIGPNIVEDDVLVMISFMIFMAVEEFIFLSLKAKIVSIFYSNNRLSEESQLRIKRNYFSRRSQVNWGIPKDFISPLNWKSAIFELSGLEHNLTPSFQLQVLTRSIKAVYHEFKFAVLPGLIEIGKPDICIAADDLIPIFIYIFCQTNLEQPILNRESMWNLCHPDQLRGESGYYLTVYESAIEFVLNEPIERESFAPMVKCLDEYNSTGSIGSNVEINSLKRDSTKASDFMSRISGRFRSSEENNFMIRESFV